MVSVSRDPWISGARAGKRANVKGKAVTPEEGRQGKKDKAATQDCNMASAVFLSQTAVILTKRSSSHPCGVRLESPNLSAALLDLVAYGRPGLHSAAIVMCVYMLYSCKAMTLISVFQTRPPCIYLISIYVFHSIDYTSFRVSHPFCTRVGLYISTTDRHWVDCIALPSSTL